MAEILISTCVLIGAIMIFRKIARDRVSPNVIYAVWLLAAIRILVPFDFSSLIPPQRIEPVNEQIWYLDEDQGIKDKDTVSENEIKDRQNSVISKEAQAAGTKKEAKESGAQNSDTGQLLTGSGGIKAAENGSGGQTFLPERDESRAAFSWKEAIVFVWAAGAAGTAAVIIVRNILFHKRLKKCRIYFGKTKKGIKIYAAEHVGAPFVFGFVRPVIYIDRTSLKDRIVLQHVLEHELGHIVHKDHFWHIVRWLCFAVQWFNPFVWAAAFLSLQDAEMACDYHVIYKKEAAERLSYGKSLIKLASTEEEKNCSFLCSPVRSYHHKAFKERIAKIGEFTIIKRSRNFGAAVIAAAIFAAAVMGCGKGAPPVIEESYSVPAVLTKNKAAAVVKKDGIRLQAKGMMAQDAYGDRVVETENGFCILGQPLSKEAAEVYIDTAEKSVRPLKRRDYKDNGGGTAWEGHKYLIGGSMYSFVTEADGRDALYVKKAGTSENTRVCYFDKGMSPYKPWIFVAYDSENQDIYYFSETLQKGNTTWDKDKRRLVKLDLETGKQKNAGWISADADMSIYAAAGDNILYKKNENIAVYNLGSGRETVLELPNRDEFGYWLVRDNKIYYMAKDKNTVLSMDLTTGEEALEGKILEDSEETAQIYMTGFVWDNHLIFHAAGSLKYENSYIAMDISSGEKSLCRFIEREHRSTDIIGETDKQFLIVRPNDEAEAENSVTPVYMLIDKGDYWNGDYDKAVPLKQL